MEVKKPPDTGRLFLLELMLWAESETGKLAGRLLVSVECFR